MSDLTAGSPVEQYIDAVPLTGATITLPDTPSDMLLWMAPAASIAAQTITLPTEANSRRGQRIGIGSSKAVVLLNIVGATSILNGLNTLNAGDYFQLKKVAPNTWARAI